MLASLWNLSGLDQTLHFVRPVIQFVASGHAENTAVMMNSVTGASSHCFAQRPVTAAQRPVTAVDAWCCLAPDQMCSVTHRAASGHLCWARFFVILRPAWFQSSCLDFA